MKRTLAIAAVAALSAGGFAAPAFAADGVSARYGCRSITFTNNTSQSVTFNYGINGSEDPGHIVVIAAGGSKTVSVTDAEARYVGWSAKSSDGTTLQKRPDRGTNITTLCGPGQSKAPGGGSDSGGLAKTGL